MCFSSGIIFRNLSSDFIKLSFKQPVMLQISLGKLTFVTIGWGSKFRINSNLIIWKLVFVSAYIDLNQLKLSEVPQNVLQNAIFFCLLTCNLFSLALTHYFFDYTESSRIINACSTHWAQLKWFSHNIIRISYVFHLRFEDMLFIWDCVFLKLFFE